MNNFKFLLQHLNQKRLQKRMRKKMHCPLHDPKPLHLLQLKEKRKKNDLLIHNNFYWFLEMDARMPGGNAHLNADLRLDQIVYLGAHNCAMSNHYGWAYA